MVRLAHRLAESTIRLAPCRRQFYACGEWTPELRGYVKRHGLDLDLIRAHAGHIAVGLIRFHRPHGGNTFSFDRHGEPGVVVEALRADGHTVADLVAWPVNAPERFSTAIAEAEILGIWQMLDRGGRPLSVHATPLQWLKAGCTGCCPLDPRCAGYWLNIAGGPFVVAETRFGRELRAVLGSTAGRHEIFVQGEAA